MTQGRLHDRIALVTGAGSGFGFAAASSLMKAGAHVVALSGEKRAPERPTGYKTPAGDIMRIRIENEARPPFPRIAAELFERFGRIDILLNALPIEHTPSLITRGESADFDAMLARGVLYCRELIRAFDPLLQSAPQGRAFFSVAACTRKVRPFYGAAAVAQAALEMLIDTYAAESILSNIDVRAVDPGYAHPRMGMESETPIDFRVAADALTYLCTIEALPEASEPLVLRDLQMPTGLPRKQDLWYGNHAA